MIEPICAVCGETKIANLYMFNYGMCLCHRCMETAAQTFVHDSAERKLKESEADVEAKVRATIEAKRRASRIAEEAIKFANGTHESLSCKCPGCGKLVPKKDMKRFQRGHFYGTYPSMFCPDCFEKKNMERDIQIADQELKNYARKLEDLKTEYESFRERTSRVWWGVAVAGFAIGTLVTLMFLNPR